MPGALSRPPNMRDQMYLRNWRIGYTALGSTIPVLILGAMWVKFKRDRYDRFIEKCYDPAYQKFMEDHTCLTPVKYDAMIKRLASELEPVKARYGVTP